MVDAASASLGESLVGPITFRKGISAGGVLLIIVGLGTLVVTGFLVKDGVTSGLAPGLIGLVLMGVGIGLVVMRQLSGKRLTVHEHGMVVEKGGMAEGVRFDQVTGLGISVTNILANGVYSGATVRLSLWRDQPINSRPEFLLDGVFKGKNPDHEQLGKAIPAIRDHVGKVYEQRLAAGKAIAARGVTLTARDVRFGDDSIPLAKLARVTNFEHKVSFFRQGDVMPYRSFSETEPNVYPIMLLANGMIAADDRKDETVGGLGRVLMNWQSKLSSVIIAGAVAALFLVMGLWVFLAAEKTFGIILIGIGVVASPVAVAMKRSYFRCHERGISRGGIFGARELEYSEIERFVYAATMHYVNGAYTGTSLNMRFCPRPGSGKKTIDFGQGNIQKNEDDLNALRDHIAGVIASGIEAALAAGQEVPWGDSCRLTPVGIFHARKGFFGKDKSRLVTYGMIEGMDMDRGILQIREAGVSPQDAIVMRSNEANFFPGLIVLSNLLDAARELPTEVPVLPDEPPPGQ